MKPDFIEFVAAGSPPGFTPLPLVHSTAAYHGVEIAREGEIRANQCPVFKEPLVYCFYGCARYRPQMREPAKQRCWFPMAFIVEYEPSKHKLKRVFPFDSGGFKSHMYGDVFHPDMLVEEFEVPEGLVGAHKCVKIFYGDNARYMSEEPLPDLKYAVTNFHVNSYYEFIKSATPSEVDDRRSALEFQFSEGIRFTDTKVAAVIVPDIFLDEDSLVQAIKDTCGVSPLTYKPTRGSSDFMYGALSQVATQFIEEHYL